MIGTPRQRAINTSSIYFTLTVGALLLLIPFGWMVSTSLKTWNEADKGSAVLMPAEPQWQNYPEALDKMGFRDSLANTVVITTSCVVGQIISCSLVGFGFARFRFRGRNFLFVLMLSTMMLPGQVTMLPVFIMYRYIGWIDTFFPLILPAWLGSPFFIFMFRQFFAQIPESLLEAARIDGSSSFRVYWTIMLPLSTPVIAIVAIYTFLGTWNDFMGPLLYLHTPENRTLALALNMFNGHYGVRYGNLLMAATCVTLLPCVILFFSCQRYFVDNAASTGLTG